MGHHLGLWGPDGHPCLYIRFCYQLDLALNSRKPFRGVCVSVCPIRWLKFEEDVEDGGERWSKPYVATLSLHSLFELRSCILNGTVLLDMRANSIEEIAGQFCAKLTSSPELLEALKPNVSVGLRHGDRQHGGLGPAEGGAALQGAGGHAEEAPPPEREEAQQSHPAGPLHR